ncbi:MAG TPA: hypothetical protein VFV87_01020 [Pirellulaceae bacterium]|nr:hypothetical protein [Pirellulaceae bacterium]
MNPGRLEMEGGAFQEFSSSAVPAQGLGQPAQPGRCEPERFHVLDEFATTVAGPQTDVNSLDYARCKTQTLVEVVRAVGTSITDRNLSVLQDLASARRQESEDDAAEQLLQLVAHIRAGQGRS